MRDQNFQKAPATEVLINLKENKHFPIQSKLVDKKIKKWVGVGLLMLIILSISIGVFFVYPKSHIKRQGLKILPITSLPPIPATSQPPGDEGKLVLKDPGEQATITIPKSSFVGKATFEISSWTSQICNFEDFLRPTGIGVSLKVIEWIKPTRIDMDSFSFIQPIDIEMYYKDKNVTHLDENKLVIYNCNPSTRIPEKLPTQVDTEKNTAAAQIKELGEYNLYAPLICPEDISEFDDDFYSAVFITERHAYPEAKFGKRKLGMPLGQKNARIFDIPEDEDWFKFEARKGVSYILETSDLAAGVDTSITIYDTDVVTEIITNDNVDKTNLRFRIDWAPPESHFQYSSERTYFIQVRPQPNSSYGCRATYNFSITERG